MKRMSLITATLLSFLLAPALSLATNCHEEGEGHDKSAMSHAEGSEHKMEHGEHDSMKMSGGMIMLGEHEKDGVMANLHMKDVSKKMAEMGMDVTHHFMVALTDVQSGKTLEDGVVAVKITDPSGKEGKAVKLMGMQGHFGVDVTLKEKGEYHFKVASKLADGKTRTFHTLYEVK